jgi:aryl-alcohol dehydrogenase-like predicted oxidoreductase
MKYRKPDGFELALSEIGFGLWNVTSAGLRATEAEKVHLLHRAVDLGVNLFMTEGASDQGTGEELLARALREQRDQLVLASRISALDRQGFSPSADPESGEACAETARRETEATLRRLRTDHLDLLLLHPLTLGVVESEPLWETLEQLEQEGKIRSAGASLGPGIGWLREGLDCLDRRAPAFLEHPYNLLDPFPGALFHGAAYRHPKPAGDDESGPEPAFFHGRMLSDPQAKTAFLVRAPHCSGMLDGSLSSARIAANEHWTDTQRERAEARLKRAEAFSFLTGKETGRTLGQAALLWLLAEKTVTGCLPNIGSVEQLNEFALAPDLNPLTVDELERVREIQAGWEGEHEPVFRGTMTR